MQKSYIQVTYRDIAKMLASALPVEGEEFGVKVNEYLETIKALPREAKLAMKVGYIFSRKVPRQEREDMFQDIALAVFKVKAREERLAYAIARCDWRDFWRKYMVRQHYSLDSIVEADEGNPDRVPLSHDGKSQPCSCSEIKSEAIEAEVWNTICQLIKDPDLLIQELHRRNIDNSQTKEILERELQLCQARLKAIPEEQRRLVEGYRKGLYADFMMREDMELIQKEQGELEKRKAELEGQLPQRFLTQNQEAHIRSLAEKISIGLDNLDFTGKQELLRLLVEKVFYDGQRIEILTIIPLNEQLHPIHRGG